MIILKANYNFTKSQIEEFEKDLSEKIGEKVCIIPHGFDIVEIAEEKDLNVEDYLLKDMVDIEDEQGENKTDLVINIRMKTDEKSFEIFKRKLAELKNELSFENKFEVVTKDKFIGEFICCFGGDADLIKEYWNEISKIDEFNETIGG